MARELPLIDCDPPLVRDPLTPERAAELAVLFKALADPARVRLLALIAAHEGGEACVCNLVEPLGLSQPTVSHHLKILLDAGLLERDRRGSWNYYRVVPASLNRLGELLASPVSTS
jgi:ArsR family transcriptional regulator, arsenate/arsenite/antimonite-responsive transcriptional repressor